ncbi:MAG: glycosyltransferase [Bacteroidia bacterium]
MGILGLITLSLFHFPVALALGTVACAGYTWIWWQASRTTLNSKSDCAAAASPVCLIVACRNEATAIPDFFEHLKAVRGPLIQVIWIDDHSDDGSLELAQRCAHEFDIETQVQALPEGKQGKKAALNAAQALIADPVQWIWYTDADCLLQPNSLEALLSAAPDRGAVLGGLHFKGHRSFLSQYQQMENAALLLLTRWGLERKKLWMANGGNLLMHRSIQQTRSKPEWSGGDDIFTLETLHAQNPAKVAMAAVAVGCVHTGVETGFFPFLDQRLRWMRKTTAQVEKSTLEMQFFMGLFAALPWVFLIRAGFFVPHESAAYGGLALLAWVHKINVDLWVVLPALRRSGQIIPRSWAWALSIFQTIWLPILGLAAQLPISFSWKGRKLRA